MDKLKLGILDKLGGVALGGLKAVVLISAITTAFKILPASIPFVQATKENSVLYRNLQGVVPKLYGWVASQFPLDSLNQKLKEFLPASLGSKTSPSQVGKLSLEQMRKLLNSEQGDQIREMVQQLKEGHTPQPLSLDNLSLTPQHLQSLLEKYPQLFTQPTLPSMETP